MLSSPQHSYQSFNLRRWRRTVHLLVSSMASLVLMFDDASAAPKAKKKPSIVAPPKPVNYLLVFSPEDSRERPTILIQNQSAPKVPAVPLILLSAMMSPNSKEGIEPEEVSATEKAVALEPGKTGGKGKSTPGTPAKKPSQP